MKSYQHILVGIDFSNACLSAVKTAVRLAPRGVPLTMLHVVDPRILAAVRQSSELTESEFLDGAFGHIHKFLSQSGVTALGMTVELEVGHPVLKLVEACDRHQTGLLVLGTRGTEHGPNKIGAVAAKCVRRAPADVLLVHQGANERFKRVTACVDYSDNSAEAVRKAGFIARADHAELDCIHVYQPRLNLPLDYGGLLPGLSTVAFEAPQGMQTKLDQFLNPILHESGLTWSSSALENSSVREGITEHIRATKSDLVVLGTRGKSNLSTLLIGTTAERIVTHAPCSVLAVKPEALVSHHSPSAITANAS